MVIRMTRNKLEFEFWNVTKIENRGDFIKLDTDNTLIRCNINGEWFANYSGVFVNDKTVDKMEVYL